MEKAEFLQMLTATLLQLKQQKIETIVLLYVAHRHWAMRNTKVIQPFRFLLF